MFGTYLKQTREELALTQTELIAKLHLADEEFLSLDVVTLSRWEREKTKPNLSKCIRVLRCLKTDLTDFYDSIPDPDEHEFFDTFARVRFHSHLAKIQSSGYETADQTPLSKITEKRLLMSDSDDIWEHLKSLYTGLGYTPPQLLDVNLFDYQLSNRAVCKKFLSGDNEQLLGHSISFIFPLDYFEHKIRGKTFNIDLTESVSYRETTKLAGCNYNRFASSYEVFRCIFASKLKNLVKHSNVHRYYFFTMSEFDAFFDKLGFEKIAVDVESEFGGVKVGNKRFERCLYGIDSDKLISRPEIITLIKTTSWNNEY